MKKKVCIINLVPEYREVAEKLKKQLIEIRYNCINIYTLDDLEKIEKEIDSSGVLVFLPLNFSVRRKRSGKLSYDLNRKIIHLIDYASKYNKKMVLVPNVKMIKWHKIDNLTKHFTSERIEIVQPKIINDEKGLPVPAETVPWGRIFEKICEDKVINSKQRILTPEMEQLIQEELIEIRALAKYITDNKSKMDIRNPGNDFIAIRTENDGIIVTRKNANFYNLKMEDFVFINNWRDEVTEWSGKYKPYGLPLILGIFSAYQNNKVIVSAKYEALNKFKQYKSFQPVFPNVLGDWRKIGYYLNENKGVTIMNNNNVIIVKNSLQEAEQSLNQIIDQAKKENNLKRE